MIVSIVCTIIHIRYHTYIYIYIYTCVYIYIYIYMLYIHYIYIYDYRCHERYMCVCACRTRSTYTGWTSTYRNQVFLRITVITRNTLVFKHVVRTHIMDKSWEIHKSKDGGPGQHRPGERVREHLGGARLHIHDIYIYIYVLCIHIHYIHIYIYI